MLARAAASPPFFYSLICLENRTFNSVGIPGPAAATSYLLEDSDNPTGCACEGRGQEDYFSGTCHSVPSIASNVQKGQRRHLPEVSVLEELQFLFRPPPPNLVLSVCDSVRFRALSSVTAAVANETRSLFLNFPPLSPPLIGLRFPPHSPLLSTHLLHSHLSEALGFPLQWKFVNPRPVHI